MNSYVDMVIDATRRPKLNNDAREDFDEALNPTAAKFYELLKDADESLWEGCNKHIRLLAVT